MDLQMYFGRNYGYFFLHLFNTRLIGTVAEDLWETLWRLGR